MPRQLDTGWAHCSFQVLFLIVADSAEPVLGARPGGTGRRHTLGRSRGGSTRRPRRSAGLGSSSTLPDCLPVRSNRPLLLLLELRGQLDVIGALQTREVAASVTADAGRAARRVAC